MAAAVVVALVGFAVALGLVQRHETGALFRLGRTVAARVPWRRR